MKTALSTWDRIGKSFLNLVYPLECQICKTTLGPFKEACLCDNCKAMIRPNLPPFCLKCGRSLARVRYPGRICRDCRNLTYYFDRAWAAGHYEGALKECIHLFKFGGRMNLLAVLTEFLLGFARLYIRLEEFDAIVPVPLHKTKVRERTFNHAHELAKAFSQKIGIDLHADNLIKIRHTPAQSELSREKREQNLKGAFMVSEPSFFKNKNVLLLDDVFTTGCTLSECAKIMLRGGAREVSCLVLARG